MTPSDDDRIGYLAGEPAEPLPAEERSELDALRALLDSPATWAHPDPDLEDRVVNAIAREAEARVGPAPAAPSRGAPGGLRLPPVLRRRPAFAFGSLAAVAAVIVLIVVLAGGGGSVRAPLRFAMVVNGTPLASGAHGSATLTKTASGWRIELSATGLPHLDNGRFYQAWLRNAAGVLVPIGTFNDARHVTLWSGVPVTKFRTLTVTTQLANGNPASSGRRVLIGTIKPPR